MSNTQDFGLIILMIVAGAGFFFLLREFWCWFWKINERCDLLESILAQLKNDEDGGDDKSADDNDDSQTKRG